MSGRRGNTKQSKSGNRKGENTSLNTSNVTSTPKTSKPLKPAVMASVCYDKCPCGASSKGNAWVLTCTACPQQWHNTCANLKGISQDFITNLEEWECPLCFVAPGIANRHSLQLQAILLKLTELEQKNADLEEAVTSNQSKLASVATDVEVIKGWDVSTDLQHIQTHMQHQLLNDDEIKKALRDRPQPAEPPVSQQPPHLLHSHRSPSRIMGLSTSSTRWWILSPLTQLPP